MKKKYFRNSEFHPLLIVGVSLRRNLVLAFLTAILSVPSRWSSYEIVLEAYNLIKLIIKTLNHAPFCCSVLETLLVSFSVTPPPPSPYGYLVITATLFWPLGKTGHVAIQRPYIFL